MKLKCDTSETTVTIDELFDRDNALSTNPLI